MKRAYLLGTAVAVLSAGPAFALTMTPTTDNRSTSASASAGIDFDANAEAPGPGFPSFVSEVSANASDGLQPLFLGDAEDSIFGSSAYANARQSSDVGALSITGSGSANASGSHGYLRNYTVVEVIGGGGGGGGPVGGFEADAFSGVEIFFNIDEAAVFDLSGFLQAGLVLPYLEHVVLGDNDSEIGSIGGSRAAISLSNTDTLDTIFETSVDIGSQIVDESGLIGPGNYKFHFGARASVDGLDPFIFQPELFGDSDGLPATPIGGYASSASFEGVALTLRAADKPIPEPMTTTLACMGLGALVLKTSRRRTS